MARKFLYLIAVLIVLVIAALAVLRIWASELSSFVFVPDVPFRKEAPLKANAYADPAMWFARPGDDALARWQPGPAQDRSLLPTSADPAEPAPPAFAVFFVHPTSFTDKRGWNDTLDSPAATKLARVLVKGNASPFNQAREIWAPRYRQAALGAFLTNRPAASQALDLAYGDVAEAFDYFIAHADPRLPIVLAGHSQGSLQLLRLYRERIKGTPLAQRVVALYAIGWPVSLEHDLPQLGLPPCADPTTTHCVVSWLSFAEPADPGMMLTRYRAAPGFDGQPRGNSAVLCFNPLTHKIGDAAPAADNLGTLVPNANFTDGELEPARVSARCNAQGLLLISDPPDLSRYVFPGNNYHVFDIPLFWRNLQLDVAARVAAFAARQP